MHRLIFPTILALAVASPAFADVRNVSGFTKVEASAGADVQVTVGPAFHVEVTGPGAARIRTRVVGDTLRVEPTPGFNWGRRAHAEVRISMPQVRSLAASSGADISATGLSGGHVTLETSSGADIEVAGTCRAVSASASSGSDIDAGALRCGGGSADASSGSDIVLNVTGVLNVNASSGADVRAMGAPTLGEMSLSSGGSFHRIS